MLAGTGYMPVIMQSMFAAVIMQGQKFTGVSVIAFFCSIIDMKMNMYRLVLAVSDFRSGFGCFAVGSLVMLPIWLFALHTEIVVYLGIPVSVQHAITFTLSVGRSLCVLIEVLITIFCLILFIFLSDFSMKLHCNDFSSSKTICRNFYKYFDLNL